MARFLRAHQPPIAALAVSTAFATAVCSPASAEEAEAAEARSLIEEIIVTATYRETSLMKTPQAISAISDALVEDLYTISPG